MRVAMGDASKRYLVVRAVQTSVHEHDEGARKPGCWDWRKRSSGAWHTCIRTSGRGIVARSVTVARSTSESDIPA